jgi:TonB family protein
MSSPTREPHPGDWRSLTANDRFKVQWQARLAWSTVAAVAAHAAVFLIWPAWEAPHIFRDSPEELTGMRLVSLLDAASGLSAMSAAALVIEEESDAPPPDDSDTGTSTQATSTRLSAWEVAALSEGLRDRLLRESMPVPTLAEPDPERPSESPVAGDADRNWIGGDPSATDLEQLAKVDPLELDRLASLRPELALLSPSSWVLVSNPTQAVQFMRTRFGGDGGKMDEATSLSVAIWIDDRGSVEWAEIHQSSSRQDLDELALEFFREVVSFHPARDGWMRVPVSVIFWLSLPW